MRFTRLMALRLIVLALTLPLFVIGSGSARAVTSYDWTTWGGNNQRTDYNSLETTLGVSNVNHLTLKWSYQLGGVTINQPLYASGVTVNGVSRDIVYIGSENGYLRALDAHTGALIWYRSFGSITTTLTTTLAGGVFGISGTPVIDRPTNRIYVATVYGKVYGLSLSTGGTVSGWPVTFTTNYASEYVWSALTTNATDQGGTPNGNLLIPTASHGDDGVFYPGIVKIDIASHAVTKKWCATTCSGSVYGGSLWGYGGVSEDATGNVYAAPDESHPPPSNQFNAQHVVRLSSTLSLQASNYPSIPNAKEHGQGTVPVHFNGGVGCPNQIAVENKSGNLLVYNTNFTSSTQPVQAIAVASASSQQKSQLTGSPAWDPVHKLLFVANLAPTDSQASFVHGLIAFEPDSTKTNCPLSQVWSQPSPSGGSSSSMPLVVNATAGQTIVLYGDGPGRQVLAYDAVKGTALWKSPSLNGAIYGTPTVTNGMLYIGTFSWSSPSSSKLYAFGLP